MRESVAIALGVLIGIVVGIAIGMLVPRVRSGLVRAGGKAGSREEVIRLQEEAAAAATRAREAYASYVGATGE